MSIDLNTLIVIAVVVVAIYIFIKLIVSPVIKAAVAIVILLLAIYILQKFFNFNLQHIFGQYAIYFDITKWGVNLNWLLKPIVENINKLLPFIHAVWPAVPNAIKP